MKEAGELLGVFAGAGEFPAIYAGGILEGGGLTVGGPAVATEGRGTTGEEDRAGPGLPAPEFVPWMVKLAQLRRDLFEECTTMLRSPTKAGVSFSVDKNRST